ncbi:MAG: phosphatase PAP2 family protein, partial [Gammaproteobacteria bacterium]
LYYYYLDKPIAFFVYEQHWKKISFLKYITWIPNHLLGIVLILFPLVFFQKKLNHLMLFIWCYVVSLSIAYVLHDILKIIFGRYWPMTWNHSNPSLIRDNIYGFNWFHGSTAISAFPSGHATIITAAMVMIVLFIKKLYWLAGFLIALVCFALVALNYHFLSDVIAGILLGALVSQGCYTKMVKTASKIG